MRRSPLFFIGILLLICAGAAIWQKVARGPDADAAAGKKNGVSAPASVSVGVLSPVGRGLNAIGAWAGDVGRSLVRRGSLAQDNQRLRQKVADLQFQVAQLQSLKRQNDDLRRLAGAPKLVGGTILTADVVAYDGTDTARKLVLNVGSRQGVKPKDVVYTAEGVIGNVDVVAPTVCFVPLPTNLGAGIGAKVARSGAPGIVMGTGEALCHMEYMPDWADVREGDTVVTSGMVRGRGQIYPGGLTIGRVVQVRRNKTLSQTEALIQPAVQADNLLVVHVRTSSP